MLTLIINANMNTLTVITVCNSAEVRVVARFGFHLTDLPRKPASSFIPWLSTRQELPA